MATRDVRLVSVGTALPGPPIDNARLTKSLGMNAIVEQWIDAFIGTRTRHLAVDLDTGQLNWSLADLGEAAAREALSRAGLAAGDVDLVVMGTSMPDALLPTTVNQIADRLGIDTAPTFQLQSGCSGAMQALDLAHQALLAGRHRTALVIGGDVCAKHVDLTVDYSRLPPSEMVNTVLFGDGAGAVVLGPGDVHPGAPTLHRVLVRLTGLDRAPAQTVEWFGPGDRGLDRPGFHEDFKAIADSVPTIATEVLAELLEDQGWSPTDVDFLLPPQLSGRMTEAIVKQLDLPAVFEISCVADTGNTGNALPFSQLRETLPQLSPGDRVVAIAVESSKWIRAGLVLEQLG